MYLIYILDYIIINMISRNHIPLKCERPKRLNIFMRPALKK